VTVGRRDPERLGAQRGLDGTDVRDDGLVEVMIRAALRGGAEVLRFYCDGTGVRTKADASPVTEADLASEAVVLAELHAARPEVPVVSEEQDADRYEALSATEFFLVDPLDGTREFLQRRADFTVNIALVRRGAPAVGVVYAPARDELFVGDVAARLAERSRSWNREGGPGREAIRVRPSPPEGLTVVASRSHRSPETDEYLSRYAVSNLVSVGSSLKFCLLAAGEADLYPRLGTTMEWDTAAGHAVLLAAGGSVVVAGGAPLSYGKPGFRNPHFVAATAGDVLPPDGGTPW
jgi:3'(2'), 5'-bisphosphate nucleotidase